MDALLRIFIGVVYAAESIISPLADVQTPITPPETVNINHVSFGMLLNPTQPVTAVHTPTPSPIPEDILPPASITPTYILQPTPTVSIAPTPEPRRARKQHMTIALIGDSMVDTLGPGVPSLVTALKRIYPSVEFRVLNYGVGATNVEDGPRRIQSDYTYLGNSVPSMISQHPDIVVIESFGYNPFPDPVDPLTRHWIGLGALVQKVKDSLPHAKILMAATIAPNDRVFGDGAAGVGFDPQAKREQVARIRSYLENVIKYAKAANLPYADAYTPSKMSDGNGKLAYINGGDHIHYSDEGRVFFSSIVARSIARERLLE